MIFLLFMWGDDFYVFTIILKSFFYNTWNSCNIFFPPVESEMTFFLEKGISIERELFINILGNYDEINVEKCQIITEEGKFSFLFDHIEIIVQSTKSTYRSIIGMFFSFDKKQKVHFLK